MYKSFSEIINAAKQVETVKLSVAAAQDPFTLESVYEACKAGIADAVLVGNKAEIEQSLEKCNIPLDIFEIEDVDSGLENQAARAVELIAEKKAQVLMKGMIDTSILLKAVLNEKRLEKAKMMSGTVVLEPQNYHKLLLVSDPSMIIKPDLDAKKEIIMNTAEVARAFKIEKPKVAVLCAKEKVNEKMPETVDAQKLVEMNEKGDLPGCTVAGPLAMDLVVSKKAAEIKGVKSDVAGDADIILAPEIVAANSLVKSLLFLGNTKGAGVICGCGVPVIVTSRANSAEERLNSIAIAALMSAQED